MYDSYVHTSTATILAIDSSIITLDSTIFYPQGGGQPCDIGFIDDLKVISVTFDKDLKTVLHSVEGGIENFSVNQKVNLKVNWEMRYLHMKLHSAGHLMDAAVEKLRLPLIATKGFHFPSSPKVEYSITGELADKAVIQSQIQDLIDSFISQDLKFHSELYAFDQIPENLKSLVSSKLSNGQDIRVVTIDGFSSGLCGGTHVKSTAELESLTIRKIEISKSTLKLCYKLQS